MKMKKRISCGMICLALMFACSTKDKKQQSVTTTTVRKAESIQSTKKEYKVENYDSTKVDEYLQILARDSIKENEIELLRTGFFHGEDLEEGIENKEWHGLFQKNEYSEIKQVDLQLERVKDAVLDKEGEKTGKQLTVTGEDQPLFLVRGLAIKETQIPSAPIANTSIHVEEEISLQLQDKKWQLQAIGKKGGRYPVGPYFYRLINLQTKQSQIIAGTEFFDDANFSVLWAGDLDNDQQLDLLLDVTDHYNVQHLKLFLSGAAKENQLIGAVAECRTVGC